MFTSQAFTQSRDVNADLSHTAKHGPRPASRPVASSLSRHSSPDETVPSTESTQERRRIGTKPRRCTITTLDPAQLDSSCFLDLSGATNLYIYDHAAPEAPRVLRVIYTTTISGQHKFPPDTHGFLYFHPDAHNPLQSQIRFRVTRDRNPTRSFSSGHDLTYGSGFTWHIPLVIAAKNPNLRDLLVRDGLIDDVLLAELQARPPSDLDSHRLKRAMSVLDQPFILDFTNRTLSLVVRVAGQVRRYYIYGPLTCYQAKGAFPVHEAGSALCRLERSTLPQHAGRRIVVMRLLKVLQPPKLRSDLPLTCSVSVPAEGKLFAFRRRVWYRNADKPGKSAEILQLLYDAPDDGEPASGQLS
ncbi:hypothetical protein EWM64_g8878 [Hericium alpestre]|uniref:Uncharacterized protein n=1 Tax=Hericium alpestre TaxID=135208 RepID=A0A4Y9ZLG9_9AGAM|nr:hypothetical protein EWM64_g8878 [Hericium alpestre]